MSFRQTAAEKGMEQNKKNDGPRHDACTKTGVRFHEPIYSLCAADSLPEAMSRGYLSGF